MKINLAVHTATEGHRWHEGACIPIKDLNEYGRIIKQMSGTGGGLPDPILDVIPFGGVFVLRNKVVFYRFHIAKKIDSKGRDALYLILGECRKPDALKIDFNALFAQNEMAAPIQPFPTEMEYAGAGATSCRIDFKDSFKKVYSGRADLSILGYILANCPNEDIQVKISGTLSSPCIAVRYKATQIPKCSSGENSVTSAADSGVVCLNYSAAKMYSYPSVPPRMDDRSNVVWLIMVIVMVFSLLIGGLCGYFIHGFTANRDVKEKTRNDYISVDSKKIDENNLGKSTDNTSRNEGKVITIKETHNAERVGPHVQKEWHHVQRAKYGYEKSQGEIIGELRRHEELMKHDHNEAVYFGMPDKVSGFDDMDKKWSISPSAKETSDSNKKNQNVR